MGRRSALLLLVVVAAALAFAGQARAGGPIAWCGSGEPTTDQADAVDAVSWHLVYALPSNGVDRFAAYAPRFAGDVAAMTDWWVGQDAQRRPRFDLLDAGCDSEYGRVDISFLRLTVPAGEASAEEVRNEAIAAGFDDPFKAYLVYVDDSPHAGDEYGVCGQGGTDDVAMAYSFVFLPTCGQSYSDDTRQMVAMHEIVHGLGAVVDAAPHACNAHHVCDAANDLMKSVYGDGDWLGSLALDVGRDDYYGHGGTWWDTRNSLLLYRQESPRPEGLSIGGLTATNIGTTVLVNWSGTPPVGSEYEVLLPDGSLWKELPYGSSFNTPGEPGQILQWTVRALDPAGWLGAPATIRFKVGLGLVDANGALLRDTVAPTPVRGLRARLAGKRVVLRWRASTDTVGVSGYRVTVPGLAPRLVHGTQLALPRARVRGKRVTVAAVDAAGNRSDSASVRVKR